MCGIAGVVDSRGAQTKVVDAMLDAIAHRGPDGRGVWIEGAAAIGNCRLAVVDLSKAAAQPMHDPSGRYVLTFNGAIYNHPELRAELAANGARFRSSGDTEVLLAAYAHWGPGCLERLNGMFAFAIWDRRAQSLFAARDRLGVKPLIYVSDGQRLAFASEHKALVGAGLVGRSMAPDAIYEYLARGYVTGDRSWFSGVRTLPPGHTLMVGPGREPRIARWWHPSAEPANDASGDEWADRIAETIDDAVRIRLRSDVPVGVNLSGGLDSSAIAAAAARHALAPVASFTGAFPGSTTTDERPFARLVSEQAGLIGHDVELDLNGLGEEFDRLIALLDEPTAGPAAYSQLAVSRLAAKHGIKVTLGGQGGDELFGGYTRHRVLHLRDRMSSGSLVERVGAATAFVRLIVPELRRVRQTASRPSDGDLAPEFLASVARDFRQDVSRGPLAAGNARSAMRWDLDHYLPALLHVDDRTTMASSIEGRTPLLDHRLVELVLRIPDACLLGGGDLKPLLRSAVGSWVPRAVALRRDKRGFPTPFERWRGAPSLREAVEDLTTGARANGHPPVFTPRHLQRAHELPDSTLWRTVMVQGWLASEARL